MKNTIAIKGKGDSLWGKSAGEFLIEANKTNLNIYGDFDKDHEDDMSFTVDFYGTNTHWTQYTDSGIAKEVNKKLKKIVEEKLRTETSRKLKVSGLFWSEQGMQPEKGWNFDVVLAKGKK